MSAPIYTTVESVKVRLANKVQFQQDPNNLLDGEVPNELLAQLISDAETMVEQDLRSRYAIPFRSIRTSQFVDLPDHSKRAIRTIVDMRAVIIILSTDFGRGTHVNGEEYFKQQEKLYSEYMHRLLGRDPEAKTRTEKGRYRFSPPLDDVQLAPTNTEADDGFKGMLINTDGSERTAESYAIKQINDPSKSYIRKRGWGGL